MIERYDIDPRLEYYGLARDDSGDYVRYADIAYLLEEKTIEQHRAEFERWTRGHYFLCEVTLHREGDNYSDLDMDLAWEVWKASRGII